VDGVNFRVSVRIRRMLKYNVEMENRVIVGISRNIKRNGKDNYATAATQEQ